MYIQNINNNLCNRWTIKLSKLGTPKRTSSTLNKYVGDSYH